MWIWRSITVPEKAGFPLCFRKQERKRTDMCWTGKFIYPEYTFGIADSMVTGFHMPYSSTLLTAVAFGGYDMMMNAYKVAIKEEYRFGCYGDAMLII